MILAWIAIGPLLFIKIRLVLTIESNYLAACSVELGARDKRGAGAPTRVVFFWSKMVLEKLPSSHLM